MNRRHWLQAFGGIVLADAARAVSPEDPPPARLEVLHHFGGYPHSPVEPRGELVLGERGELYSCARGGRGGLGVVFALDPASRAMRVMHTWPADGSEGDLPNSLMRASDGALYGTTYTKRLDTHINGTLFRIGRRYNLRTLYVCAGGTRQPEAPEFAPIEASDGQLYGVTFSGGEHHEGTVYRVVVDGRLEVLHSFHGHNGMYPSGGLMQADDGWLYGAAETPFDGTRRHGGLVYRISLDGQYEVVRHFFVGKDRLTYPVNALTQASDGNLYGLAASGGTKRDKGGIFRIERDGSLVHFHIFNGYGQGQQQYDAPLLRASDGYLYGINAGGRFGAGTLYRISLEGDFQVVHAFQRRQGGGPQSIVEGLDGRIYGTLAGGGIYKGGGVFAFGPTSPAAVPAPDCKRACAPS